MSCPNWQECTREKCHNERVCMSGSFWSVYWKSKTDAKAKPCPYVHLCDREDCKQKKKCQENVRKANEKFQNRKKTVSFDSSKKTRNRIGDRAYARLQKQQARAEVVSNSPYCVKNGTFCDKHFACSIMNECIVGIPRIAQNPSLVKALKGPRSLKEICRALKDHDPQPMRSYFLTSQKKVP